MIDSKALHEILIVSAEASSELYARRVIEECKSRNLPVKFFGIGSATMGELGCEIVEYSEKMAVVGLWEVLAHWTVISQAFKNLLKLAKQKKPTAALLLDYPDFNLRLARKLKKQGVPVFYYISPQVWAWRTSRVNLIKKIIYKMLVVFPFEVDFYKKHNVAVSFVGHPLLDEIKNIKINHQENKKDFTVGIMPGSRESELQYNFVAQVRAAEMIAKEKPETKFVVLVAPSLDIDFVKTYLPGELKVKLEFIKDEPFKMLNRCSVCMVASGTATLMVALAEIPMVILYKMNPLTASLARKLVKGKYFGMPNLILDEMVVPELFQENAKPDFIANEILKYIKNPAYYLSVKNKLKGIKEMLGHSGAATRVVDELQKVIK